MKTTFQALMVGAAALSIAACTDPAAEAPAADSMAADASADMPATTPMASGNIVEVAQGDPQFSNLVAAVQSAGLVETLSGPGPFTVFAPTNTAFEAIPQADRDALMVPAQAETLGGILTYHVVAGRMTSADVAAALEAGGGTATLTTVEGGTLIVRDAGNGTITLTDESGNTATITAVDVEATNGVVHVIDKVLMPS